MKSSDLNAVKSKMY